MLIYYALNITSLKVTDRAKPRVRNSPISINKLYMLLTILYGTYPKYSSILKFKSNKSLLIKIFYLFLKLNSQLLNI